MQRRRVKKPQNDSYGDSVTIPANEADFKVFCCEQNTEFLISELTTKLLVSEKSSLMISKSTSDNCFFFLWRGLVRYSRMDKFDRLLPISHFHLHLLYIPNKLQLKNLREGLITPNKLLINRHCSWGCFINSVILRELNSEIIFLL